MSTQQPVNKCDAVSESVYEIAADIVANEEFLITGLVMRHPESQERMIVECDKVRRINSRNFSQLMNGEDEREDVSC